MKKKLMRLAAIVMMLAMLLSAVSISASAETEGYIKGSGVNFRSGPGSGYSVIGTYAMGKSLYLLEELNSGWCKVQIDGQVGYVYGTYVGLGPYDAENYGYIDATSTRFAAFINRDGVNFRSGPGTGYGIINCYDLGKSITVLEELNSGWCKVDIDGTTGYVYGTYVSGGTQSADTTSANIAGHAKANVNVYAGTSTSSRVVTTAYIGQNLTIDAEYASGWCAVTVNGLRGYIYGTYVGYNN